MKISKNNKVLVSGASIAGLTTAWWLNYIGYAVTIVEQATAPRTNGAAVDLTGPAVDIARRMGLYDQFKLYQLGVDRIEYKNSADETEGSIVMSVAQPDHEDEIEIERDNFVKVMMSELQHKVAFIFGDTITALNETDNGINVTFKNIHQQAFDLVFGCDGAHSLTRKIWFGPEEQYARFLKAYFSISIVPKLLLPQRTMQVYSVPYRSVMLNAYNGKTDIIFMFISDQEMAYDYRDTARQRQIIETHFTEQGWRVPELLDEIKGSDNFYFDKFCQIRMPAWSKGHVVLIGDAAYCPSPAAGQGGSLAIRGAAAVADALVKYAGDYVQAFPDYERQLRSDIEEIQAVAEHNVQTNFILRTEEEIQKRNEEARLF